MPVGPCPISLSSPQPGPRARTTEPLPSAVHIGIGTRGAAVERQGRRGEDVASRDRLRRVALPPGHRIAVAGRPARCAAPWRAVSCIATVIAKRWQLGTVSPGAPGRTRTCDTRFRKPLLYPLSYEGLPALRAAATQHPMVTALSVDRSREARLPRAWQRRLRADARLAAGPHGRRVPHMEQGLPVSSGHGTRRGRRLPPERALHGTQDDGRIMPAQAAAPARRGCCRPSRPGTCRSGRRRRSPRRTASRRRSP